MLSAVFKTSWTTREARGWILHVKAKLANQNNAIE